MMLCPACKQPTRRTRKSECIHCRTPIELFTYIKDDIRYSEFRLPEPEKAMEIIEDVKAKATVIDAEGRLLTPPNSNPEIILVDPKGRKKYKVVYRQEIPTGWLYCPNCHGRMHQNIVIDSRYLAQEFDCHGCKAIVSFVFISSIVTLDRV